MQDTHLNFLYPALNTENALLRLLSVLDGLLPQDIVNEVALGGRRPWQSEGRVRRRQAPWRAPEQGRPHAYPGVARRCAPAKPWRPRQRALHAAEAWRHL